VLLRRAALPSLDGATQFVELCHIHFAQVDDARHFVALFRDEASCAKRLIASRTDPWATPNLTAHLPSTILTPGSSEPFMISVRSRLARSCFTSPSVVKAEGGRHYTSA